MIVKMLHARLVWVLVRDESRSKCLSPSVDNILLAPNVLSKSYLLLSVVCSYLMIYI